MSKKVFLLSESFGWSGGAAQLLALAKGLAAKGWEAMLFCPEKGTLHTRAMAAGIEVRHWAPFQDYDLKSACVLSRLIDSEKPDVVHAHHPRAHAVGLAACYLAGHKPVFVVSRRVSHPLRFNIFSQLKYKSARIDGYIAVADAVGRILSDYGIAAEKITTVYSGVDEKVFYPRTPDAGIINELALPAGVPVIGLVGNYSRDKGQHLFFKAAALLAGAGRRTIVLCAGRDTGGAEIKAQAAAAGVASENLRLLGFREDVPQILSVLTVSINAAIAGEAISGSIRESMAMGVPVVASDISGHRELIRHGETGYLVPVGDYRALSAFISRDLDAPENAGKMAAAGLEFIKKRMTIESMVNNTESWYLELMRRRAQ